MESGYAAQLQEIVQSWDYWQLERDVTDGKGPISQLPTIPKTFSSVQAYTSTFQPLLLEEAAAQLLRGQDEGSVALSQRCVVAACEDKGEGRLLLVLTLPPGVNSSFSENDVVLVSRDDPQSEESTDEVHHALGMVAGHEGEQSLRVRFNLSEVAQAGSAAGTARQVVGWDWVKRMSALLPVAGSGWWLLRLANTSTIQREWAAVHCMAHSPLHDVLLSAKPSSSGVAAKQLEAPPRMLEAMAESYNASQLAAVTAGLDGTSLTLIQGPPGTGKTKTILGLLSIVLHAAPRGAFSSQRAQPAGEGSAAQAGKPEARARPSRSLTPAEVHATWQAHCHWLTGAPDPREAVVPAELADPSDDYGLTRRAIPFRIGKSAGIRARVLVCAPANSALDEIVLRLITSGLTDKDGKAFTPSVVRVGVNIHHSVQSVALDTLVTLRLGSEAGKASCGRPGSPLQPNKRSSIASSASRLERDRARMAILEEASIVCTTLSFSGSASFVRLARKFDVVIVDEAAQAVEPAVLVPLAHGGARQVYLVGDPVQLPATVLSSRALAHGYSGSLFSRLQSAGYPVQVLDTQYRMHPAIREFPSATFYGGGLKDGADVAAQTKRAWHASPAFAPLVFYDVPGREGTPAGSNSLVNTTEAEVVLSIYRELIHRHPELRGRPAVAVISPYKAQVSLLRRLFLAALGPDMAKTVDINTIDGFQGREKDVAIFSTVRSSRRGSIGFVADERRMNVGLTRARSSLLVVGNAAALAQDGNWGALVSVCATKGCLYSAAQPYNEFVGRVAEGQVAPQDLASLQARAKGKKERNGPQKMEVDQPRPAVPEGDDPYLYSDEEEGGVGAPASKLGSVAQGVWAKRHVKG
ncbi:hypothetical protein APUTEX25_004794 [Auxenochlorella protothecoides]|uniref:Helicase MAGATAMA 3 n=2 Tax=Auxenochlorella protothecoides TaxID=3075 RepID=A0A3M7KW00_AUXPR|nr:hypothetical protein APUTEX25_004794 [Auxenochlorella protothecoides]|eukprot:RMZ53306.1 hypothetical protein APUTEX25_004794 [Auxenochlorella protothecoides]